jgi:O-methyltransferase domain
VCIPSVARSCAHFARHDESIPAGADAYVLKSVLHDWDDARATAILAKPEKAEHGRAVEAYLLDLEMLVNTPGGRERTEAEFRAILPAAGFTATRVVPTTAPVSVIVARPV